MMHYGGLDVYSGLADKDDFKNHKVAIWYGKEYESMTNAVTFPDYDSDELTDFIKHIVRLGYVYYRLMDYSYIEPGK